jgi:hypothetical protein
MALWTDEASHF